MTSERDTDDDDSDAGAATTSPEFDKLRAEREELYAQVQRARADYQNLRKRTQVDIDNSVRRSLESLFQNLFLVVDNLDLALRKAPEGEEAKQIARGIEMTRELLLRALTQEGAQPIPESEAFDPNLHEAVATVETKSGKQGSVVDTLRRGWTWRGQVVRPAHVRVAAAPKEKADPSADSD